MYMYMCSVRYATLPTARLPIIMPAAVADASAGVFAERRRRITKTPNFLAFNQDKPLVTLFCTFRTTMLPVVLLRVEVWLFTGLHTAMWALKHQYPEWQLFEGYGQGGWNVIINPNVLAIPASVMGFLLVFFNSACYSRFCALYGYCTAMSGAIQEFAQMTSTLVPDVYLEARWDACRYLVASVMVVYAKVTDLASSRAPSIDRADWDRMLYAEEEWLGKAEKGVTMPPVLNEHEAAVLMQCRGQEVQVLQTWAVQTLQQAAYGRTEADTRLALEAVLKLRGACLGIINTLNQPIPLPYYHSVCAFMFVNYFLLCFSLLSTDSYLTPLAMFVIVMSTTAVRELSSAMANPFGDDEVDFKTSAATHALRKLITFLAHPCNADTWKLPGVYAPNIGYDIEAAAAGAQPAKADAGEGGISHEALALAYRAAPSLPLPTLPPPSLPPSTLPAPIAQLPPPPPPPPPPPTADDDVSGAFRAADANADGRLNRAEFGAFVHQLPPPPPPYGGGAGSVPPLPPIGAPPPGEGGEAGASSQLIAQQLAQSTSALKMAAATASATATGAGAAGPGGGSGDAEDIAQQLAQRTGALQAVARTSEAPRAADAPKPRRQLFVPAAAANARGGGSHSPSRAPAPPAAGGAYAGAGAMPSAPLSIIPPPRKGGACPPLRCTPASSGGAAPANAAADTAADVAAYAAAGGPAPQPPASAVAPAVAVSSSTYVAPQVVPMASTLPTASPPRRDGVSIGMPSPARPKPIWLGNSGGASGGGAGDGGAPSPSSRSPAKRVRSVYRAATLPSYDLEVTAGDGGKALPRWRCASQGA